MMPSTTAEPDASMNHASWNKRLGDAQRWHRLTTALTVFICTTALVAAADLVRAADSNEPSLRKILASVAHTPLNEAPFIRLKTSGLLAAPIESRGTLSYSTNGRIEQHTTSPIDERIIITDQAVRIERVGEPTDELSFAEKPALTAYAQGLRAILAGDPAPLYEHFLPTLDGDDQQWRMTLRPKSMRLQTAISSLVVTGTKGLISSIETFMTSGDVDTLTILRNPPPSSQR